MHLHVRAAAAVAAQVMEGAALEPHPHETP